MIIHPEIVSVKRGRKRKKMTGFQLRYSMSKKKQDYHNRYNERRSIKIATTHPTPILPHCCVNTIANTTPLTKYATRANTAPPYETDTGLCSSPPKKNKNPKLFHADHILIPYTDLCSGIENHLSCRACEEKKLIGTLCEFGNRLMKTFKHLEKISKPISSVKKDLIETLATKIAKQTVTQSKVSVTQNTVGIATTVFCKCESHGTLFQTQRDETKLCKGTHKKVEDYAMNIGLTLAVQSFGGGGSEADRIISFLQLQHAPSFGSISFHHIETTLSPIIQQIAQDSTAKVLEDEITSQLKEDGKEEYFSVWKDGKYHPMIDVSYDMGWQKRGGGNQYNSSSGHGLMIGKHTKKCIDYRVKVKECAICKRNENKGTDREHNCIKNHEGSSKSMEVDAILDMVIDSWDSRCFGVRSICADDDTTMISHLKHSIRKEIDAGLRNKGEWPMTESGRKKTCHG